MTRKNKIHDIIPGIDHWMSVKDIREMTFNGSPGLNVKISQWVEKTGLGYSANQGSSSFQFTYRTGADGLPELSAVNAKYMVVANGIWGTGNTSYTIMFVGKNSGSGGGNDMFINNTDALNQSLVIRISGGLMNTIWFGNNFGAGTVNASEYAIWEINYNATNGVREHWKNGVRVGYDIPTPPNRGGGQCWIGENLSPLNAYYKEWVSCKRVFTPTEREKITRYLANEWGITI